ncbi:MAG: YdbC family protein [Ruminococcus sp.]|nr:YdbC family protein [Ruminococcus sp.]
MAELKFEITESLGVLSENAKGWTKELNKVSWSDHEPKYDIREWSPDHTRMGKGVTLTDEELANLKAILNGEELEDDVDDSMMV